MKTPLSMLPWALLLCLAAGCGSRAPLPEVLAYTALEAPVVQPLYDEFSRTTGIRVKPRFGDDPTAAPSELAAAIIAQGSAPDCDVFANAEILNTILLDERGLLDEYPLPGDADTPPAYRAPRGAWHVLSARARVLIVNTSVTKKDDKLPRSLRDLTDGHWRGRIGVARPWVGTTATHAACLFVHWGPADARQFFLDLRDNSPHILGSSQEVALAVGAGQLAFGWTDSDAALAEAEKKSPVAIVYPDQDAGQMGTLFIPATVAIIRGAPHPQGARRLVDFMLSAAQDANLGGEAIGAGAAPLGVAKGSPGDTARSGAMRHMDVDFAAAAHIWESATTFLRQQFAPR